MLKGASHRPQSSSLLNMPALVAGEFVAVIGVNHHHAVTFRHFAREFSRHHFSISLFFFHNAPNIEIRSLRSQLFMYFFNMENAKTVKQSQVETRDIVHPSDVNAYNYVFGGHLTSLLDKAACIAAYTHARRRVTTISIDNVRFFKPATVGTILTIKASVNRVFNTSMEVGVKVMGVHPQVSWQPELICHAYMTFVAVDDNGIPTPIPSIIPETEDEIRRFEEAEIRRNARKALADQLK